VNLVLTGGRKRDPAQFGPQPEQVHIARYIPHSLLLPPCDTVLAPGSINTVMAALRYGLPLVLLPIAGEQPHVAAHCAELGIGRTLVPTERAPGAIRAAVHAVLGDPGYRTARAATRGGNRGNAGAGARRCPPGTSCREWRTAGALGWSDKHGVAT